MYFLLLLVHDGFKSNLYLLIQKVKFIVVYIIPVSHNLVNSDQLTTDKVN
jgi:hypothetical protein